jgi:Fe-S cluster assembly scaffold protein SufB
MMSSNNDLTVYFGTSTQQPVYLKALIEEQFIDCCIPDQLVLTIVVAAHVSLTLCDDLVQEGNQYRHTLIFVLSEAAQFAYTTQTVATLALMSDDAAMVDEAIIEKDITVRLVGKHANATVVCSCYGSGQRVFRYTTRQEHCVEQTTSSVTVKGVVDQGACLISKNMIAISPQAQGCNAQQVTRGILLSPQAHALSIPQLEIQAHDVVCKHGAAISALSDEEMFYLQSRGIDALKTRQILVQAFLD